MTSSTLLFVHSWVRWLVVVLGAATAVRAVAGWARGRGWSRTDERVSRLFVATFDLQVLVGLVLYLFASPITTGAFQVPAAIMANTTLRFWVVEHPFAMITALTLAHLGRVKVRRASDAPARHRLAAAFFGLAVLVVLIGLPWPFTPTPRPLWRGW